MTRVISARSIARLAIGTLAILLGTFAGATACDHYIITGVKSVVINESRTVGSPGILVSREIDIPAAGADTAIVALSLATLSFSPFMTLITLPDTTRIQIQPNPTDHKLNTAVAQAQFDGFSNDKAKIKFAALLNDKNADDPFYAELGATVIFLKCCDVKCGASDSTLVWGGLDKLQGQFGTLNAELTKLKEKVAALERRR